jgi:HAD superfamily hydrolase (TIGR01450 family)
MHNFDYSAIRALILDMDGVLWRGPQPIGDLKSIFKRITIAGWKVAFATNNATRSIGQYVDYLKSFGLDVEPWQVINSATAAANYLHERFPDGGPVFIIGEQGLKEALAEHGFYPSNQGVMAVIAGMDRTLTYEKLRDATLLIRTGAPFIGTNPDHTFPTPQGLVPGAGSILAALMTASDVTPIIVGKPEPEMYRIALDRLNITPTEVLVVGDRPETDIIGAQAIGCPTALVLSGVTTIEQAKAWQPPPDIITQDLETLVNMGLNALGKS